MHELIGLGVLICILAGTMGAMFLIQLYYDYITKYDDENTTDKKI